MMGRDPIFMILTVPPTVSTSIFVSVTLSKRSKFQVNAISAIESTYQTQIYLCCN